MSSLYDSDISDTAKNPMYFCIPTTKEFQTAVKNEIQVAKQLSALESLFNQIVNEHHAKRLGNLLFVNGFERKALSPDGKCFSSQFYHTLHQ
jgi:hypothetical protein